MANVAAGDILNGPASPETTFRALRREPLAFLSELAKEGDVVRFGLGGETAFLVNDVSVIEEVLVSRSRLFSHEPVLTRGRPRRRRAPERISLATTDYEGHNRRRRELQPAVAQERSEVFARVAAGHAIALRERLDSTESIGLEAEASRLALGVVCEALFGRPADETLRLDVRALVRSLAHVESRLPRVRQFLTPAGWQRTAALARIEEALAQMTEEAPQDEKLIGTLMRRANGSGPGTPLPSDAVTILAAGEATLTSVLCWSWLCLARHPEAQAALEAEADEVLGDRAPTLEDLPRLEHARMIAAETLRLYPPNWFVGRRALEDTTLGAHVVPKHAAIIISPYLLHRDQRHFPEPERFDSSRFSEKAQGTRPKNVFIPFGLGTRRCLGERIAWITHVLTLATLARGFRFEMKNRSAVGIDAGITLMPAGSPELALVDRRSDEARPALSSRRMHADA